MRNLERDAWAFAGTAVIAAAVIAALREPQGIRAAVGGYFGGVTDVVSAFIRPGRQTSAVRR